MLFEREIRELEPNERTLPLMILFPNNNNKTALETSLDNQSPKSFYIMIDLLKDFSDICITKYMLNSLKYLLSSDHSNTLDFFNDCSFRPL